MLELHGQRNYSSPGSPPPWPFQSPPGRSGFCSRRRSLALAALTSVGYPALMTRSQQVEDNRGKAGSGSECP
eukprot:1946743-Pyramimonas_sp.AAC.1